MKVMTFNIQHLLYYPDMCITPTPFADLIRKYDVDFCGLNEVRGEGALDGYTDQTNTLGDALGYARYFGEAIRVEGNSPYGNAVVSRFPLKIAETVRIPDPARTEQNSYYESRCIIRSVVEVDETEVCFLVCHMGLVESERQNAVKALCSIIDHCSLPVIVMGDFNATPNASVLAPLFERLQDTASLESEALNTFSSYDPHMKIDYILYRGLQCISVQTIQEIVSDHFPIFAEFALPSAK